MQLTKYAHSCVALTKDNRRLVLDPGVFSDAAAVLADADAVLVTHEHPDHVDVEAVRAALRAHDSLTLHGTPAVAATFAEFGERVTAVGGGESFEVAGFDVATFGDQHALIHPAVPMIANVGFLVDGEVFHPGDALTVPDVAVPTLLLPVSAPWAKVAEVVDYAVAVRAPRTLPIHEKVYSPIGLGIVAGHIERIAGPHGVGYDVVEPGATVEV